MLRLHFINVGDGDAILVEELREGSAFRMLVDTGREDVGGEPGSLRRTAAEYLAGEFDAVTFVPVSLRRNFERGFDQARLLAEEAANIWGVKAEAVLRKDRHTRAQSSLQDAALRKTNVKGAYRVPHPERVRGRRFLLIDDVCTTGSTLSAAADALLEAGAAGVVCAVLAGGSRKRENSEELFP